MDLEQKSKIHAHVLKRSDVEQLDPQIQAVQDLEHKPAPDYRVSAKHFGLLASVFEASSNSVLVVDCDSKVIFANPNATRSFDLQAGLSLSQSGKVQFSNEETQSKFRDLVARAATGKLLSEPHALDVTEEGHLRGQVRIHTLTTQPDPMTSAPVIITYTPLTSTLFDTQLAQILYKLSRAELEICKALSQGASVKAIAESRGTSTETVRYQLKSIFSKTNTNSQHGLVSLLLTTTALPLFSPS